MINVFCGSVNQKNFLLQIDIQNETCILIIRKISATKGQENIFTNPSVEESMRQILFCESVNQKNFLLQIDFQINTCILKH